MSSVSCAIDKVFRRHVCPMLREHGFEKIGPRNAWAWRSTCTLVFEIRAVGRYFADVTGWPPSSVCVWLGAWYEFVPGGPVIKRAGDGRPLPAEVACHMRAHLTCRVDQTQRAHHLANPKERERREIWWVEPDGSNAEAVAIDVTRALKDEGIPGFERWSDLTLVLADIEQEHDCYTKFLRAYHVAKAIGDDRRTVCYRELLIAEGKRIGQVPVL